MPRRSPAGTGGVVFHVFNRSARRLVLFASSADYEVFLEVMVETAKRFRMRLLVFCIMPNHWHLVLWPERDGDLSGYMTWLTKTHAQRWRRLSGTTGEGAVYQGPFRAVPVQSDHHLLVVCRYVERNPVRAGLARRAEDWRWSSASRDRENCNLPPLSAWPISQPANWLELLNGEESASRLEAIRASIRRSQPIGEESWRQNTGIALALRREHRGRPASHSGSRLGLRQATGGLLAASGDQFMTDGPLA